MTPTFHDPTEEPSSWMLAVPKPSMPTEGSQLRVVLGEHLEVGMFTRGVEVGDLIEAFTERLLGATPRRGRTTAYQMVVGLHDGSVWGPNYFMRPGDSLTDSELTAAAMAYLESLGRQ